MEIVVRLYLGLFIEKYYQIEASIINKQQEVRFE